MIFFANLTKKPIRKASFVKLYKKIFFTRDEQAQLELSVVFASPTFMRKLNKTYRKKDKVANVLSFLLEKGVGEIFLNRNEKNLPNLFVHGCLHLKGYDHEDDANAVKMERMEDKILNS